MSPYAAMLIEHCHSEAELPEFLCSSLLSIDSALKVMPEDELALTTEEDNPPADQHRREGDASE